MDIEKLLKDEISDQVSASWSGKIGGQSVTLYSTPVTPADIESVSRRYPDFTTNANVAGLVHLILIKACDDEGNRVFNVGRDGPLLRRFGVGKIQEIAGDLFGSHLLPDQEDVEDAKKN